jgi:hypothetical protein
MRKCGLASFFFLLVLAIAMALACGSPAHRLLQSVSISPTSADADGNPVQFTATGDYDTSPFQVTPLTATWGACYQDGPTALVSVSTKGLAQCKPGSDGTYTVWAWAPSGEQVCPQVCAACGGCGCAVVGTAQLTCP